MNHLDPVDNDVRADALHRQPARVGIDARMLSMNPTGVGNYIAALLNPMALAHPETAFLLYSNSRVKGPARANVEIREGGARIGPLWMNAQLPRALRADRIDVFWGANGVAPIVGAVPSVVTVHDLVYRFAGQTMSRGARWTKRCFQGRSVRRARQVVAVSSATAADVTAVYGRPADAIIRPVISPAFRRMDPGLVREAVARRGLPDRYWLCTGTLEPRKNLASLLAAYLDARAAGLSLPMLALAGNMGWASERVDALIARGEASGSVRRLGYVPLEDLACLYGACELFWMPSIYEGYGMVLPEAQRCGAPVVHGEHASMREASAGLGVATAVDEASLRQAIERIAAMELPLACRPEQGHADEAEAASAEMWARLCRAAAR